MEVHTKRHLDYLDYHIEVAGNFQKVCDGMLSWIQRQDLRKEQIVSITANQTATEESDAVLVLVYKRHQEPSMTSLNGLAYHLLKNTVDWDDQYKELSYIARSRCEVISLTHTARNIG
jgi:hypothetical protein